MTIIIQPDTKYKGITFNQSSAPSPATFGDTWIDDLSNVWIYTGMSWKLWSGYTGPGQFYGYNMGGVSETSYFSTIDRITFPFDSGTASAVGNLTQSKYGVAGCNSSNYGYCMGGYSSNSFSTIDRITFPFDSGTASAVGNLTQSKFYVGGCNSSNYGYNMGGLGGTSVNLSGIDRITFPFNSGTASVVGNLSQSKVYASSCDGTDFVALFN